jgi:hypothetical protein
MVDGRLSGVAVLRVLLGMVACVRASPFSITSSAMHANPSGIHIDTGNVYIDIESFYVTMFPRAPYWTVPQQH